VDEVVSARLPPGLKPGALGFPICTNGVDLLALDQKKRNCPFSSTALK